MRPITPEAAALLNTVPIAVKCINAKTYRPSSRSLSVILEEQGTVKDLPKFLITESGPTVTGMIERFFQVDEFEEAVAAYGLPIDG